MSRAIEFRGDFTQFSWIDLAKVITVPSRNFVIILLFIALVLIGYGLASLKSIGDLYQLLKALFLPTLLFFLLFITIKIQTQKRLLYLIKYLGEVSGIINEIGFSYRTRFAQVDYPWSEIHKFQIRKFNTRCNLILIYPTPYEFFIVLEDFFDSSEAWEEAKQIIADHIIKPERQSRIREILKFSKLYIFLPIAATLLYYLGFSAFDYSLRDAYRSGREAWKQGDYSEAEKQFRFFISFYPQSASANHYLALALHDQNKLDEAEIFYKRALDIDSNSPSAHYGFGNLLYDQNKPEEAITAYRQAIRLKPDYTKAHRRIGDVFYQQGQLAQALTYYQRFLDLDPESPQAARVIQRINQIKETKTQKAK
jgi:tetratricopeptide (TPR) repeat protein